MLECHAVPWDTEVFGFPVAEIGDARLGDGANAEVVEVLQALDAWCAEHGVELVSCRLDNLQLRESMALEALGFRFVETVFEPRMELDAEIAQPRRAIRVEEAGPHDSGAIDEIARDAFTTGRFLLDPRLPPELSGARYANWVRTSLEMPSHRVLKAHINGALFGFFIVEHRNDGTVYWHLTAVAPGMQGQGLGLDLWRTMLLRHRAEGATRVETTISGHNLAAINLYARLGFRFASSRMTFHWLRGPARV